MGEQVPFAFAARCGWRKDDWATAKHVTRVGTIAVCAACHDATKASYGCDCSSCVPRKGAR